MYMYVYVYCDYVIYTYIHIYIHSNISADLPRASRVLDSRQAPHQTYMQSLAQHATASKPKAAKQH